MAFDVQLTVTVSDASHGSVEQEPVGELHAAKTAVTLTAVAEPGFEFECWTGDVSSSDNPLQVTLDTDLTVTAVFHAVFGLSVTATNGSAAKSPDATLYADGTQVELTATAASGFEFESWSGDLDSTTNPATITVDANKSVSANFHAVYTLTIAASNGSVSRSPAASPYADGTTVQLTPSPSTGYLFDHWEGDLSGSDDPASVTMDANKSVTAVFVSDFIEDEDSSNQSEADDLSSADAVVTQQTGSAKYLHLAVPNYDENANSATAPRTYLRLGAFPDSASDRRYWGDDMLDAVGVPTSATPYFKDDYRHQNQQTHPDTGYTRWDGRSKSLDQVPTTLTGQLRSRGGWRQHTDGNYLSTTRGDRVDVYYGNYKMVVLGRMDAPDDWSETYWESSGGHTRWATNTQGDMVLVRWNADRSRWRTYEETIRGDLIDRYQGVKEETFECPRIVTMIGSPDPPTTAIADVDKDPHTQLTTDADGAATDHYPPAYAGKWSKPGGRLKERPNVNEEVYAKDISATTKVTSGMATKATECSDSTLTVMPVGAFSKGSDLSFTTTRPPVGAIVSKKSVATSAEDEVFSVGGRVYETLTVNADVTVTEETGWAPADATASTDDAVRVDHVSDLLFCFGKVSSDITHITKISGYGGWTFNFSLVGAAVDIGFGVSVRAPKFERAQGDWFRTALSLSWATTYEISFALALEVNIGMKVSAALVHKIEADLTGGDDYSILAFKAGITDKRIHPVAIETNGVDNDTSANMTES